MNLEQKIISIYCPVILFKTDLYMFPRTTRKKISFGWVAEEIVKKDFSETNILGLLALGSDVTENTHYITAYILAVSETKPCNLKRFSLPAGLAEIEDRGEVSRSTLWEKIKN